MNIENIHQFQSFDHLSEGIFGGKKAGDMLRFIKGIDEADSLIAMFPFLRQMPDPELLASLHGSFVKIQTTQHDIGVSINGNPIIRVAKDAISTHRLRPIDFEQIRVAGSGYDGRKVAELLGFDQRNFPRDERNLLQPLSLLREPITPTGYYLFRAVMRGDVGRNARSILNGLPQEEISAAGYAMARLFCQAYGVPYPEELEQGSESGVNSRTIETAIQELSNPLTEHFRVRNIGQDHFNRVIDDVARRFDPSKVDQLRVGTTRTAGVLDTLYKAKRGGVLVPIDEELVSLCRLFLERTISSEPLPLDLHVVACPRFGEHDEYDVLEDGLSITAQTYLKVLPTIDAAFSGYGIPYQGTIFVNNAEAHVAGGALLVRLGLTEKHYQSLCAGNVAAINSELQKRDKPNISAQLLTDAYPEFTAITQLVEKRLMELMLSDDDLRILLGTIADARLDRHAKIMGRKCDFSESMYLTIHYAAEYLALSYLDRQNPAFVRSGMYVNYNSPNKFLFNNKDLLSRCIDRQYAPLEVIPVIEVKYY